MVTKMAKTSGQVRLVETLVKSNINGFCWMQQVIIGNILRIDHVFRCCNAASFCALMGV
jgi:hypothetical protein